MKAPPKLLITFCGLVSVILPCRHFKPYIKFIGKIKFLGYFKTEIEASNAYKNELLTISTKPLLVAGAVN